jgi:hypothetical protein
MILSMLAPNFPGTAKLYRFNTDRMFINKIGKAGRGPGENAGYIVDAIHFCNYTGTTLAKWNGPGDKPQLYGISGELLYEMTQPGKIRSRLLKKSLSRIQILLVNLISSSNSMLVR